MDDWLVHAQFLEILLADEAPPASALAELPEPQAVPRLGLCVDWGSHTDYHVSTTLVCMLAHERLGSPDGARACATVIIEAERHEGGTPCRLRHSFAHACRGRLSAAEGKMDEAETAFEAAVEVATACGSHFFAALALRDLCKHVLEAAGRGEEGKRRLAEAVSGLACSVEDLDGIVYP